MDFLNNSVDLAQFDELMKDVPWYPTSNLQPINIHAVGAAYLGCRIDGRLVAYSTINCEYKSQSLIIRTRTPKACVRVWNSGRLLIMGARGTEECKIAARRIARIIQKCGFPVKFLNFRIVNVTAHYNIGSHLRIIEIAKKYPKDTFYEPEFFPASVTFDMTEPKGTALVFYNGKIILLGLKSEEFVSQAFEKLFFILKDFKKIPIPPPIISSKKDRPKKLKKSKSAANTRIKDIYSTKNNASFYVRPEFVNLKRKRDHDEHLSDEESSSSVEEEKQETYGGRNRIRSLRLREKVLLSETAVVRETRSLTALTLKTIGELESPLNCCEKKSCMFSISINRCGRI